MKFKLKIVENTRNQAVSLLGVLCVCINAFFVSVSISVRWFVIVFVSMSVRWFVIVFVSMSVRWFVSSFFIPAFWSVSLEVRCKRKEKSHNTLDISVPHI